MTEQTAETTNPQAASEDQRPTEKLVRFARANPALLVAGGIAAGAIVAALVPKRGAGKLARRAAALAEAAGAAGLALGHDLLDKADTTARRGTARIGLGAAHAGAAASAAADRTGQTARSLGLAVARKAMELAAKRR